jgi:hypothetical protein
MAVFSEEQIVICAPDVWASAVKACSLLLARSNFPKKGSKLASTADRKTLSFIMLSLFDRQSREV